MHPGTAALERGLRILDLLGEPDAAASGLTVQEVAERIGGEKSQVSRSLATLVSLGYAERDLSGSHRLGARIYLLSAVTVEARLLHVATPILRQLVHDLGESAHLSVREGDAVLTLASESPAATALLAPARVGGLTPIATTSSGRVLATGLAPDELGALGLDATAIAAIERARNDGCAIVREEFERGLVAAAAPVFGVDGHVLAAINVSAPAFRLADRLDDAERAVRLAAELVTTRLHTPAPAPPRTRAR